MKQIKKLILKKEVIDRLENNQMDRVLGGGNFCPDGNALMECSYLPSCQKYTDSPPGSCNNSCTFCY